MCMHMLIDMLCWHIPTTIISMSTLVSDAIGSVDGAIPLLLAYPHLWNTPHLSNSMVVFSQCESCYIIHICIIYNRGLI